MCVYMHAVGGTEKKRQAAGKCSTGGARQLESYFSLKKKIQGLEAGERNEGHRNIYSSLASHHLQKITFPLPS